MGNSQGQGNWPKPLQQRLGSPFSPWEGVGVQERGEGRAPAALQGTRQPRGPGHARERPGAPEGASADPVTPPLSTASRPHGKPDTNASGMRHRCLCTEARANRTHGEEQQPARGAVGRSSLGTTPSGGPRGEGCLVHAPPRTCHRAGERTPCPIHPQAWVANRYRKTPAASQRCLAPVPSNETITRAAKSNSGGAGKDTKNKNKKCCRQVYGKLPVYTVSAIQRKNNTQNPQLLTPFLKHSAGHVSGESREFSVVQHRGSTQLKKCYSSSF